MKTKNFLITMLLALLLMPVGAKALTVSKQDTIQVGNAAYICAYDVDTEKTLATPTITPKGATLVAYDLNATARSFTVPSTITVSIRVKTNSYEKTFTVEGITGIAKGTSGSIMHGAFEGNTALRSVTIPETVGIIGKEAFKDCTSLVNADIYVTTTSIDATAFSGCNPDNVTYNIRPNGDNTTVPAGLLSGCEGVGKVQLADGITAVGENALNTMSLFRLTMTTSVRSIGSDALTGVSPFQLYINASEGENKDIADNLFQGNEKLTGIYIGEGITAVGEYAFSACQNLTQTDRLPQVIGDEAFSACTSLRGIPLGGVTNIGANAFTGCSSSYLNTIVIPDGIEHVGSYAFDRCSSLTNVYVPTRGVIAPTAFINCGGVELYIEPRDEQGPYTIADNAFQGFCGISSVHIGEGIHTLGKLSFHGMPDLTTVTLPTTLTTIGDYAFQGCTGLTAVDIPAGVNDFGITPFNGCSGITDVYVHWDYPITPDIDPFYVNERELSEITLHVPLGNFAYSEHSYWKQFNIEMSQIMAYQGVRYLCQFDSNGNPYAEAIGLDDNNLATLSMPETINAGISTLFPVTAIADEAFMGCTALTALTLPTGLETIGARAFKGCTSLPSILNIPQTVKTIASEAFSGTHITMAHMYTTLQNIATDAFDSNDTHLIVFIDALTEGSEQQTSIPGIFGNCNFIWGVSIGADVESIGYHAFSNCSNLEWARWATNASRLKFINEGAFAGCQKLKEFGDQAQAAEYPGNACVIPDGVQLIYHSAFADCSALKEVVLPASIIHIGQGAFTCSSEGALQSVTVNWTTPITPDLTNYGDPFPADKSTITLHVPAGTEGAYQANGYWSQFSIVADASFVKDGIRYAFNSDHTALQVVGYIEGITQANIPAQLGVGGTLFPVTAIADEAFMNCTTLTSLNLPQGLKSIGARAFKGCTGINFPRLYTTLQSIATDAFDSEGTYLMFTIQAVPWGDEPSTSIAANLFEGCDFIRGITLSDVDLIGDFAFRNCTNLQWVSLATPGQLRGIGNGAFMNCESLTDFNNTDQAIDACIIPEGVLEIGAQAFAGAAFTSVQIPASVTDLGLAPFADCTQLTTITVDPANTTYESPEGCNGIITNSEVLVQACPATVIPQSVTEIYSAWLFASYLTDFTVPSGIKYIGNYSFYASTLASVTIPATVEGINAYAFNNNALRGNIKVLRPTPPELIETAFSDVTYENATLIVPAGAKAAYQAHTVWGRFLNIEEIPAGSGDVNGGGIDMSDVLDLANYIIGKPTSGTFDTAAADVNGNGDITIADVTELLTKVITPYDPTNDKKALSEGAEDAKTRCRDIVTELQGKPDSDQKVSLQKDLTDVVTSIDALRNMIEHITTQEQVKTCQVELKIINTRLNSIEEQVSALPDA